MTIPWQTLRRVLAFAIVTLFYLSVMEAALPAAHKSDRLIPAPQVIYSKEVCV